MSRWEKAFLPLPVGEGIGPSAGGREGDQVGASRSLYSPRELVEPAGRRVGRRDAHPVPVGAGALRARVGAGAAPPHPRPQPPPPPPTPPPPPIPLPPRH